MKITPSPSPNSGPRRDGKTPRLLILHYTDTGDLETSLQMLKDTARETSAHYVIDEDGGILQLVDEDKRAWHAGKSFWVGEMDVNSASIGIELQHPGHTFGYRSFMQEQIESCIALCREIVARHNILPQHVLAHSDIAPARKIDPGHLFPWRELAAAGIGLWPEDAMPMAADTDIDRLLTAYGYDPDIPLQERIVAFQRHFQPESFGDDLMTPRKPDAVTLARLRRLVAAIP